MNFFNKKPRDPEHSWLMGMVAGAGLLVMAAVFISSGASASGGQGLAFLGVSPNSQTAGGWFCDNFSIDPFGSGCGSVLQAPPIVSFTATPASYGGNTTLTWNTGFYNGIGDTAGCTIAVYTGGLPTTVGGAGSPSQVLPVSSTYNSGGVVWYVGSMSAGPLTQTTGYVLNCTQYFKTGTRSRSAATTATLNPTVSISASPSRVPYNGSATITYSSTNAKNGWCALPGPAEHDWIGDNLGGTVQVGPLTSDASYSYSCWGQNGQWVTSLAVVTVAPPPVATCPNGLDINSYASCSCPGGQVQSGSSCVVPSCPNGLDINSYPSCSCPGGQVQSGASCIPAPPAACSNGLNVDSYPSCSCPASQHQEGASCVADVVYPQPTAAITSDASSIQVGQVVHVHATFAAGSGDTLTATNIDSPEGSGLAANTSPGTKDITFTPTAAGTYTFYARVATAHYDWQSKATVSVAVAAEPPPAVPGGLSANCNAAGTTVSTLWSPVAGADHYWVGFDDTANNAASCSNGWMCSTPPDYSLNQAGTSKSFGTMPSHQNRLLVSSCTASNSCSAAQELAFTCSVAQPTLAITANGQTGLASIPVNTPVVVAWSSGDVEAGSCRVTNNNNAASWAGETGSKAIGALTGSAIYTLKCNSLDGTPARPASVTLAVAPGVIDGPLTAAPARVQVGSATHLSWHTTGMNTCKLTSVPDRGVISSSLASSDTPAAVSVATIFTLMCQDDARSFTQSVTVGVVPVVREQ